MPVVLVTDYFLFLFLKNFPSFFFRLRVVVSSPFSVLGRRTRAGGAKPLNMSRSVEEVSKLTESTYKVSACLCEYNRCNERRVKKRGRNVSKHPCVRLNSDAGELFQLFFFWLLPPSRGRIAGVCH